jgi:hypothetical protein
MVENRRRPWLAITAALTSFAAFAGTVGLATGTLALDDDLNERLPFASPVLGGIALAVVVGMPFALLARAAWHGDERADLAAAAAGVLLVGWIVVQLAFLRAPSFLHAVYLALGVAFAYAGREALKASLRRPQHPRGSVSAGA